MNTLPRKPVACASLEAAGDVDASTEPRRCTLSGPRRQQTPKQKAAPTPSVEQLTRMSEMYSLIDEYMAWNESMSDLGCPLLGPESPVRPGTSGTLFVDFGVDGEMEFSFRNGVYKKLPAPPVPSKSRDSSVVVSSHRESSIDHTARNPTKEPVHKSASPSDGTRHDSVISSGTTATSTFQQFRRSQSFELTRPPSRPLPPTPSQPSRIAQPPRYLHPQGRKAYPPQVHQTQRPSSQPRPSPPPSRASSEISFHTAVSEHGGQERYAVIEPPGPGIQYRSSSEWLKSGPGTERAGARTAYFDLPTSTPYASTNPPSTPPHSTPLHSPSIPAAYQRSTARPRIPSSLSHPQRKPLPPSPHTRQPVPSTHGSHKKRHRVVSFMRKMVVKAESVREKGWGKSRGKEMVKKKGRESSWVKAGYVT